MGHLAYGERETGIEVYTGLASLPVEFADDNARRCGAIVIWTGN